MYLIQFYTLQLAVLIKYKTSPNFYRKYSMNSLLMLIFYLNNNLNKKYEPSKFMKSIKWMPLFKYDKYLINNNFSINNRKPLKIIKIKNNVQSKYNFPITHVGTEIIQYKNEFK